LATPSVDLLILGWDGGGTLILFDLATVVDSTAKTLLRALNLTAPLAMSEVCLSLISLNAKRRRNQDLCCISSKQEVKP